jgi:hypothetical protein
MEFAAGLLSGASDGALVCAVLLIVYDLVLVTIRLDSDLLDPVRKAALWLTGIGRGQ